MKKNPSRILFILLLIVSLSAAGASRFLASRQRRLAARDHNSPVQSRSSLGSMNSFALTLMLGGLRGPLVMILWPHSENQKSARDLEGIDTQIEWIRLLQSEFDSVHLFQIWNKAFNLSVQMASLSNKYSTILDALDYAHSVDRERPNDINILSAIAQTFFDKLGNSSEKAYYRKHIREETLAPGQSPAQAAHSRRQELRRTRMDPLLDSQGNILPSLLADGELPYLQKYQPFPYGLSPFALAYNYYKRAQTLQRVGKQQHIQLSEIVVDSRPALCLKAWCAEERDRAYAAELRAFGLPVRDESALVTASASLPLNRPIVSPADRDEALYSFAQTARLCTDALAEYESHIKLHQFNYDLYQSHMDEIRAAKHLAQADHDLLAARDTRGPARAALLENAGKEYQNAQAAYQTIILKYYVDEPLFSQAVPRGYTKAMLANMPGEQLSAVMARLQQIKSRIYPPGGDPREQDTQDYESGINRASQRLSTLGLDRITAKD